MERVRRLIAGMFLTTFILGGCALPGDKQRVRLSDNWLTVPLAKSGSHTRGQQYSLHRLRNPDDYAPQSIVLIPNSGLFDKSDYSVLVYRSHVAKGVEVDGTVTFDLPPDLQSPADCFMVVNTGYWAASLSGAKSPDSKYLIGLAPFAGMVEFVAAKENLRSTKLRIAEAEARLPNSRAFMDGQCVRREVSLPIQPVDSKPPAEAAKLAEAVVIDSMVKRIGCEIASELMREAPLLDAWKRFNREFICGQTNLSSLMTTTELTPLVDFFERLLLSCVTNNRNNSEKRSDCLVGYGLTLAGRFVIDTNRVTKKLSQPYLRWASEVEVLRRAEFGEYSLCSDMLRITSSADDTITAINKSITAAEQNLDRMKAKKSPDGSYEFDPDTLTCGRALSSYYVRGKREYIDAPSIPRRMR